MTSEDAANKGRAEVSADPTEEAVLEFYGNWKHWPASRPDSWPDEVERDKERTAKLNADFLSDIREFVDRVSRERTREALERAAKICDARATAQARMEAWHMEHHEDDGDADLHHGEGSACRALAAAIRGLSDGESVASEER